jgi:alginate O-acetyltransferase complex protein AlgI
MLFNTLTFFALLALTLALYWLVPRQRARLSFLFVASLIFYGYHYWPSVFLLLGTIGFNYTVGRAQANRRSLGLLVTAIVANLSLLFWFKYSSFIADNVNWALSLIGTGLAVPRPPVFLPLGISFFTFQVIAYQVDVYRAVVAPEPSLLRFAVFKSFFAQLIAGPIVRAKDFLPQLQDRLRFNPALFHKGCWLILAGLGLKIGAADVLAQFANEAFKNPAALTTAGAWTGLYAYAFQLYADFWGYSTMAVGLAALFGFILPLNFDTPYGALSLQEFWRRWHITLSVWFRDYLYIPLGGNRRRRDLNLLLTMTVAGLWHGAGWPFVIWGFGHGLWLTAERHAPTLGAWANGPVARFLRRVLMFHGVCLLWVFFRAPSLRVATDYFARLLAPPFTWSKPPHVLTNWLIAFALLQWPLAATFKEDRFRSLPLTAQWALALAAIYLVLVFAGAHVDFIYFNF